MRGYSEVRFCFVQQQTGKRCDGSGVVLFTGKGRLLRMFLCTYDSVTLDGGVSPPQREISLMALFTCGHRVRALYGWCSGP